MHQAGGERPSQRPRGASGDGLEAPHFAALWTLARRLWACDSVSQAEEVAAAAVEASGGGPPEFARAVADTIGPALEHARQRERLRGLALRDPLTGLFNRRFMEEELARQLEQARREGQPLAVALLDLDHFRDYNERHGHLAGDLVLQWAAFLLQGFRRGSDVPCRYGGEEFVLIMPATTAAQAAARLDALRRRLAEIGIHHDGRPLEPVTVSIGVAEFPRDGAAATPLLAAADAALYRAKRSGRDRIGLASPG